jgi:hypothetical protein
VVVGGASQRCLEELAYEPEAEIALDVATATAQHASSTARRGGGVEQRRLADPRRSLEEQHAALAAACPLEQRGDLRQLPVAFGQRRGNDAHAGHSPRPRAAGDEFSPHAGSDVP